MLNASRNEVTYLKEILPQTYGIIFLDAPHLGTTILQDLEVNAQTLERIESGFSRILEERPIQVYSFQEEPHAKGVMVGYRLPP
jgi:hypothetical protein